MKELLSEITPTFTTPFTPRQAVKWHLHGLRHLTFLLWTGGKKTNVAASSIWMSVNAVSTYCMWLIYEIYQLVKKWLAVGNETQRCSVALHKNWYVTARLQLRKNNHIYEAGRLRANTFWSCDGTSRAVQQNRSISVPGCTGSIIMSRSALRIWALNYASLFLCKFKQLLRLYTQRKSNKDTAVETGEVQTPSPVARRSSTDSICISTGN